jgi:hypothetical protein
MSVFAFHSKIRATVLDLWHSHSETRLVYGLLLIPPLLLPFSSTAALPPIQTVFIIMLENESWTTLKGHPSAPYINNTLLPISSFCDQYHNLPNLHRSLPNYLWLEAGTNFGITENLDPPFVHQNTTSHLTSLLTAAGISWKAYQEHLTGTNLPFFGTLLVSCRHNPFLYFDDVTGTNNPSDPYGLAHIRPYDELAADLTNNTVARYNFIIPDDYNDMHTPLPPLNDSIRQGDTWLSQEVPRILSSAAFNNGGALFIAFDETDTDANDTLPLLVLSPAAKGGGYASHVYYTHSSMLRTMQELFEVFPYLGDTAQANNLADLFGPPVFKFNSINKDTYGSMNLEISGARAGSTNLLETSTNLIQWDCLSTNVAPSALFTLTDTNTAGVNQQFYRVLQLP